MFHPAVYTPDWIHEQRKALGKCDPAILEKCVRALMLLGYLQESAYRDAKPSRDASLEDTLKACLALAATKPKILATYPDAKLLHDGFDKLRGHLTWPEFMQGQEHRRVLAARAAVLVAHMRAGRNLDLTAQRYSGRPDQVAILKAASLNGHTHSWIDGCKLTNAEAYHYWLLGLKL